MNRYRTIATLLLVAVFCDCAMPVEGVAQIDDPGKIEIPEEFFQTAPPAWKVEEIIVEGAVSTTPSAVIAFSGIRVGDTFAQGTDAFSEAISNLYARKIFRDIDLFVRPIDRDRVTVIISVVEHPRIGAISVDGNDEIDDDDIIDESGLRPGDIANPYAINRSERAIVAMYAEEGYLYAQSDAAVSMERDSIGRVGVRFSIVEGPDVKVGSIAIEGNVALSDDDVRGAMEDVRTKSWWQFWRSSKLEPEKLEADKARIVDHYRSKGFVEARIVDDSIVIDPSTGESAITITVDEGPRLYLRSLEIVGNEEYDTDLIRSLIGVEVGEPYDQTSLEENLLGNGDESVRSWYLNNGFLTFNAAITEDRPTADSIDAVVRVTEGDPAFIRFVDIAGNTKTRDDVIRRELFTVPGDRFSRAKLIRSLRNLAVLNYFNPEALVPDVRPSADATSVDITYEVEERPSDTFNASLGLSSRGVTGSIGLSFNNFSLTEPLTGGGGQILNLQAEFGSFVQTYSLGVTEPWLFGEPTTVGGNIFYQKQDFLESSDFKSERFGVTATIGRRLQWPDDFFRIDGALRFTRNNIIGSGFELSTIRNGSEYSASVTLSRSSLNDAIFPTLGSRFRLPVVLALFGDAEYLRPEISFDFFTPIGRTGPNNTFVLHLSSELGYLREISDRSSISPTIYYTMGGTAITALNSTPLRGYADQSIGPRSGSFPIGRVKFKLAAEIRYPVTLNPIPVYLLTFAESGNVWGDFGSFDPFDLKRSIGIGMRVMMPPIGLIGFDYGYGFDADTFSTSPLSVDSPSGWRFHFQFGR